MSVIEIEESAKKDSSFGKWFKTLIPLFLGVFILWLLYRDTDFTKMWDTIKHAHFGILSFSLIFGILGNSIRAFRWKLLIEPLGYNPSVTNLVYAVLGSYAVNIAIPRGGEVWRCAVVAKGEKIPFTKLIGTMFLDRICDTIMVFAIILLACCFNVDFFISYVRDNSAISESLYNIFTSKLLYGSFIAIIIFIGIVFKFFGDTTPIMKIRGFFKVIVNDMKTIGRMDTKKRFLLYSFGIWFSYFLYFYITFYAFDFTRDLGITAGLIAFAISSLSMAIPTNGGMGAWHAAVVLSLGLYGVGKQSAEAFAFGVFALQSLSIILSGVVSMVILGMRYRK